MIKKLAPALLLLSGSLIAAEKTNDIENIYQIQYTKITPQLGDKDSNTLWESANTLTSFTLPWRTTTPPKTQFKALWNEDAIYIRYIVEDRNVVIGSDPQRGALDSDRVEIFLAQDRQLTNYYTLEVDATTQFYSMHAQYDQEAKKIGSRDDVWHWNNVETYGDTTPDGYHVEMKIPLETITELKLWQNDDQTQLLCALMRAEFSKMENGEIDMAWMTWIDPNTPKPNFHNPGTFGECQLVK
ncbi:carbohydrate-binding family 9-like protein [Vibrio nomapromontoriensis]|uniref:carbohydrate-binding family 9-like protein n=1 Tax=Vibrio nomapromontoriensis TaxID=2910246 RepID=UPI003D09A050